MIALLNEFNFWSCLKNILGFENLFKVKDDSGVKIFMNMKDYRLFWEQKKLPYGGIFQHVQLQC